MGNMSNPSINRWGLNLFWYNHWFVDSKYYLSLQNDNMIQYLIYIFLNYGLLFPTNMFVHRYWFRRLKKKNFHNEHNTKYYRIINFKNYITNEISSYNERTKLEHIYQSRIWILKFQHWILINFYCFSPVKKRQKILNKLKKKTDTDFYMTQEKKNFYFYKRFKFIFFFLVFKIKTSNTYYFF